MSKNQHLGTELDRIFRSTSRLPAFRVCLWNPNQATIQDVVLNRAASPVYDITKWVVSARLQENIVWEDADSAVSTSGTMQVLRDAAALPIPIDENTLLDGAPIRIWYGDERVLKSQWIVLFTGVIRGKPSGTIASRKAEQDPQIMSLMIVGREEAFLQTKITGRSYEKGTDVGKAATETAIEFMGLELREIRFGFQNYAIGCDNAQLVDIEVQKGIFQMLQCVRKKPRFDADGFLVAADTDLDRAPARIFPDWDRVVEVRELQQGGSFKNSIRLLGQSNEMTEVTERYQRLVHGDITAGWFADKIEEEVSFSEKKGEEEGSRRAKNTVLWDHVSAFGAFLDGDVTWNPTIEDDGYTCFGGEIEFDTGYAPWVAGALTGIYLVLKIAETAANISGDGELYNGYVQLASASYSAANTLGMIATIELVGLILAMQSMGHVEWAVWGYPFQCVFQQLESLATLYPKGTEDLRELEVKNDWLYEQDYMDDLAFRLLQREVAKGFAHEIDILDDPLIEVDDILEFPDASRHYVTSIQRAIERSGAPNPIMTLSTWRIK